MNPVYNGIKDVIVIVLLSVIVASLVTLWVNAFVTPAVYEPPASTSHGDFKRIVPEPTGIYAVDANLSRFADTGWYTLYRVGGFDCSRMTVAMWYYFNKTYGVEPLIILGSRHAWLAVPKDVFGDSSYPAWIIGNKSYYYVETTVPRVVPYSVVDVYTKIGRNATIFRHPDDVAGAYSSEFVITPEIVKFVNVVMNACR